LWLSGKRLNFTNLTCTGWQKSYRLPIQEIEIKAPSDLILFLPEALKIMSDEIR
jgi:hypothetical protein